MTKPTTSFLSMIQKFVSIIWANKPWLSAQERERDAVVLEIEKDRMRQERDQVLEDLTAVERAFSDIYKKYERTRHGL